MTSDLYSILGIPRNATPRAIQKAHRKAVLKSHPDRGGDREAFEAVQRAYECLSDKSRRAHYDKTGDPGGTVANPFGRVVDVLNRVFCGVMQGLHQSNADIATVDLISLMRNGLGEETKAVKERQRQLETALAKLTKAEGRFSTNSPDNLLESLLQRQKEGVSKILSNTVTELAILKEATEFLKDYKYRCDPGVTCVASGNGISFGWTFHQA